jgi:hypothetical protein
MAECRSVVEAKVCLTAPLHSRSVRCDLAKFPIIYPDLRLDYKVATLPFATTN